MKKTLQAAVELQIEGLSSRGEGVGRYQGLAVFVAGALPGEIIRARFNQVKKNYARAELTEIIQASAARVKPACPEQKACGGCALQHLAYEEQLKWKRRWLADSIRRIGGLEIEVLPTIAAEQTFYYRNRAQLHARWHNSQLELGFYARGSHEITDAAPCALLRPLLTDLAQILREELPRAARELAGLEHVALRCDSAGERAGLTLIGVAASEDLNKLAKRLQAREPRLLSLMANWGRTVYGIYGARWQKLTGPDRLPEQLNGLTLAVSPAAFTQVNSAQALLLYRRVAAYAGLSGAETLLDLYSGIGSIALFLANRVKQVLGVEEYAPAVADAVLNAELNGIVNCRFEAGRAEEVLPRLLSEGLRVDVAVLDPPRAGCAEQALISLAALAPRRLIYVSCDPATLARDLRRLAELGYAALQAQPLDMFPHSGHVESVTLLERK